MSQTRRRAVFLNRGGGHDSISGEMILTTCKPYLSLQELRSAGCDNFAISLLAIIIIPSRERDNTVY
ncbi:hypothetical protein RIN58_16995 [Siccibacter colletis]|uniref:hypothetical protein n=1 Tax=Siccibacter colletis TaxID=1505757 RepID=UPI0028BD60F4|nr:hypothetical protein [Siccibacter colletis]WNN48046.1 hypothetical protein RIN58_16995 [Siccibacter colletis]